MKLSTADPIPVDTIELDDGTKHDVWNYADVPNRSLDAYLRLRDGAEHLLDAEYLIAHPELMVTFIEFHAPTIPKETLAKLTERPMRLHSTYVALLGVAQADPFTVTAAKAALRRMTTVDATSSTLTDSASSLPPTLDGPTPSASESLSDKDSPTSVRTRASARKPRLT